MCNRVHAKKKEEKIGTLVQFFAFRSKLRRFSTVYNFLPIIHFRHFLVEYCITLRFLAVEGGTASLTPCLSPPQPVHNLFYHEIGDLLVETKRVRCSELSVARSSSLLPWLAPLPGREYWQPNCRRHRGSLSAEQKGTLPEPRFFTWAVGDTGPSTPMIRHGHSQCLSTAFSQDIALEMPLHEQHIRSLWHWWYTNA